MRKKANGILGRYYPFFLNNYNLKDLHYLYQVYSPELSKNLNPIYSLDKISEKTKGNVPYGHGNDIISACLEKKADNLEEKSVEFVSSILKKELTKITSAGNNFPNIELWGGSGNNIGAVKTLIVSLRDAVRWKNYKFYPGRYIDVLWTPTEFVVFYLANDKTSTWLEPVGVYKNTDVALQNPLPVNLKSLTYPKDHWDKGSGKASEINHLIKRLEWSSFDRASFVN